MNGSMIGLVGGIAGGLIGVMGGVIGTYVGIKNTNGPRERAFVVRASVICWIGVTAFLACLFLLPTAWRPLPWLVYLPLGFLFVKWMNAGQARARGEEMRERGTPGVGADGA
jgi:hypothetical protein